MKLFILMIVVAALCSSLHQASETQGNSAPARKEVRWDIPKGTWESIFFKVIDERAKIAKLKNLRAASMPHDDLEVRVWHGFGLTALEGFVLKRAAGKWSAIHLNGIHSKLPRSEYEKRLPKPKSGWELSWRRLEEAGILTLSDASAIGCSAMDPDGMSYVVEFISKGTYRTYLYDNPGYAKCDEARQIIKIGNIISEEFDVGEMSTKP